MKRILPLLLTAIMLFSSALAEETPAPSAPQKVVYLTFDDGPKADTPELLALLRELDVPATFFFVGSKIEAFPEEARMVYDGGYAIGCHTSYHSPNTLKKGNDYVINDFKRFINTMREFVAPDFTTDLFRFPGGSTSYAYHLRKTVVEDLGCAWFDWNAMTADTHKNMKAQDLYDHAVYTAAEEEVVIMLAHEGIKKTREILPQLVTYFREKGYSFRELSLSAEDRELLSYCPANMKLPEAK